MKTDQRDNDSAIKDSKSQLVILKGQKLASAVYLISKFMSDDDPLKWQLRKMSLKVASALDLVDLSGALEPIRQMVSLIEIALHGQAVSQMNFSIIKQEYLSLRAAITSEQTKFNPLQQMSGYQTYPSISLPTSKLLSPNISHKTTTDSSTNQVGPARQSDPRKQLILNFIKEKGWSSIKDIAAAVPNFSSKTVQRELIDLVRTGVLKKEGERRWSRYQLAEAN